LKVLFGRSFAVIDDYNLKCAGAVSLIELEIVPIPIIVPVATGARFKKISGHDPFEGDRLHILLGKDQNWMSDEMLVVAWIRPGAMVPGRKGGVWAPCIASDEVDRIAPMDSCSNVELLIQIMSQSNIQVVLRSEDPPR
jgi:hypothetical protein